MVYFFRLKFTIFAIMVLNNKFSPFVNSFMSELNNSTTDIYESLMDGDFVSLNKSINNVEKLMKDLKDSL